MTNWLVTLINTDHPFEKKQVIVHAETVIQALDEQNHKQHGYYARSACFHSTYQMSDYNAVEMSYQEI